MVVTEARQLHRNALAELRCHEGGFARGSSEVCAREEVDGGMAGWWKVVTSDGAAVRERRFEDHGAEDDDGPEVGRTGERAASDRFVRGLR